MNKKLLGILVLATFLLAFAPLVDATDNNCAKKYVSYGDSMYPFIHNNTDLGFEKIIDIEDLKVGDIIIFNYDSFLLGNYPGYVHRITKIDYNYKGLYIKTKGDNNFFRDPFRLREENIMCKLIKLDGETIK